MFNIWKYRCKWCICCNCTTGKWRACGIFFYACTQIKRRLVRPCVNVDFTYQVGDLVVMGHFFEKSEKTRWLYYLQIFHAWIYILLLQSFGGGSSNTSHWNQGEEGWTKEMEDVSSWPWLYYGDVHSYNPLDGWMKVICHDI